jgi:hypothetical protein
MARQELIKKIEELPPDRQSEVENFVESITQRDDNIDRGSLHQALAEYATQQAGTDADLDADLEEASLEKAIDEGLESKPATHDEVFHILENAR